MVNIHILTNHELQGYTKQQIVKAYIELAHQYMSIAVICDVCGAPATNTAVDMKEVSGPLETLNRYERTGPVKKGCDSHHVESVMRKKT